MAAQGKGTDTLYGELPCHIQHDLGRLGLQPLDKSAKDFVSSFLRRSVLRNSKDDDEVEDKVRHKALMLDTLNAPKRKKTSKTRGLSARERRLKGIHKIPIEEQKYELYLPLHKLWKGYIQEVLNVNPGSCVKNLNGKLLRADLHGCIVTVTRSKCPSYVGAHGIILQETKNVFKIISTDDKVKTIPKANSVFTFELEGFAFTIYGNHFRFRSSERSARKFKTKPTLDL